MKKLKKVIRIIIELILLAIIIFSLYMIIRWFIGSINNKKITKEVNNEIKIEDVKDGKREVDFDYLKNINNDTVGYLIVNNTSINYPVVKTTDNSFYLTHSFDKSKNVGGWIFMDYRNTINDRNVIIYGHNMKDGSMFGKLKLLKSENSGVITYIENNIKYEYKVFSVYEIDEEDYYIKTTFSSDEDYSAFIRTIKGRSIYNYGLEPDINSKILTLSTCSTSNRRLVVHAYRIN